MRRRILERLKVTITFLAIVLGFAIIARFTKLNLSSMIAGAALMISLDDKFSNHQS